MRSKATMTRLAIELSRLTIVLLAVSFGASSAAAQQARDYLLATASTGGTYYPVGVAIATLVKVKLQPSQKIGMSAINSAGSGENVKLLRENEVQFAILQGLFGYYAWHGKGAVTADGPQQNLRSVTMLWPNVEHFVMSKELAKTGTIEDMGGVKGKAVALGKRNSGTIGSNRTILANLGINIDENYELVYLGYNPSADALQNGRVVAMSTPAGDPVAAVTRAMAAMGDDLALLEFNPQQAEQADGGLGIWAPYVVQAGTYPNQQADLNTIAQPNFLAVRSDVDADAVYQITKAVFEKLPFLQAIHKATKAMSTDRALAGLPMPLHPGALKYYQEIGLQIPAKLVSQ